MAHYAFIDDNNIVTEVIVGRNEDEVVDGITDWEAHYGEFHELTCLRTSYNTVRGVHCDPETGEPSADQTKAFRGNYAGIGFTYDPTLDAFIPPQPFPSWVLDDTIFDWTAPVPYPDDGQPYAWDEDTVSWVEIDTGS